MKNKYPSFDEIRKELILTKKEEREEYKKPPRYWCPEDCSITEPWELYNNKTL